MRRVRYVEKKKKKKTFETLGIATYDQNFL